LLEFVPIRHLERKMIQADAPFVECAVGGKFRRGSSASPPFPNDASGT
jgi:hypothetical protein